MVAHLWDKRDQIDVAEDVDGDGDDGDNNGEWDIFLMNLE